MASGTTTEQWIRIDQLAAELGVHPSTVARWTRQPANALKCRKIGKAIYTTRTWLDEFSAPQTARRSARTTKTAQSRTKEAAIDRLRK